MNINEESRTRYFNELSLPKDWTRQMISVCWRTTVLNAWHHSLLSVRFSANPKAPDNSDSEGRAFESHRMRQTKKDPHGVFFCLARTTGNENAPVR
ncbi:MAG: hypothetical protein IJF25_07190 [Oscillospiraceae bacterium]|nr:hypothetical protein [Oscillospiraceae bacterium]